MAVILVPDEDRRVEGPADVAAVLAPHGIPYERWPLEERVAPDAPADEVLAAYAPEVGRLMRDGGYPTADVIDVKPDTPGLDAMLDRFRQEHTHSEDEVRFILRGRGLFHVRPRSGP